MPVVAAEQIIFVRGNVGRRIDNDTGAVEDRWRQVGDDRLGNRHLRADALAEIAFVTAGPQRCPVRDARQLRRYPQMAFADADRALEQARSDEAKAMRDRAEEPLLGTAAGVEEEDAGTAVGM